MHSNKLSRGEAICPPPIAADLHPYTDRCTVCTALVAWPRWCTPIGLCLGARWNRQTNRPQHHLMLPYGRGHNNNNILIQQRIHLYPTLTLYIQRLIDTKRK